MTGEANSSQTTELTGAYYAACNALFRSRTTQEQLMLREALAFWRSQRPASVLSVGSGTGLFEIPLLEALEAEDIGPARFVGVDLSPEACEILRSELQAQFRDELDFEVVCESFEDLRTSESFGVLLYNHTFEYLRGTPSRWLEKSRTLLSDDGKIMIFSPDRGGINQIYAQEMQSRNGRKPHFSEDIQAALRVSGTSFSKKRLMGRCDVSMLEQSTFDEESLMLLSFLTQTDCRLASPGMREAYGEYYLSLRDRGDSSIPHPTTMFVV